MEYYKVSPTPMEIGLKLTTNDGTYFIDNTLYRKLVKILIYLTNTILEITYSVKKVERYMISSRQSHWMETKRILRYIKGTIDHIICYTRIGLGIGIGIRIGIGANTIISIEIGTSIGTGIGFKLIGYRDVDWEGSLEDIKSITGYIFHLKSGVILWCSKKKHNIALSSTESEYIETSTIVREVCDEPDPHSILFYILYSFLL